MADERTEKATPRRRSKARQEGQISKSQDLNMAVTLAVGMSVLFAYMPLITGELKELTLMTFSNLNPHMVNNESLLGFLNKYIWSMVKLLMPIFMFLMLAGTAVNFYQVGALFTTKTITPDFAKLSPEKVIMGFKRFFQVKSLVEFAKSIAKGCIIGVIGYSVIKKKEMELLSLLGADIAYALQVIASTLFDMFVQIVVALFILGIIDKKYQDYEYEKSLKMTKQDVKDERKNIEGDPAIKAKIKGIQMRFAMQRMMSSVPSADVVVTNPTHYAVAIRYDTSKAPAPQVIAKGADFVAFRIREVAKNNNIPVVEDKPLARTLYKIVPLDGIIPAELYVAVAEVLAYVYKTNRNKGL